MKDRTKPVALLTGCLLAGVLQVVVLWGTKFPLGVPGEWTWPRIEMTTELLFNLFSVVIISLIYVGYVSWVANRVSRAKSNNLHCLGLSLLGFFWIFGAVSSGPDIYGLSRTPFIVFYERSSGYFTQARDDAANIPEFLKSYQARISDSDLPENYLHQGTHPPGLTIAYRLLIDACERSSILVSIAEATQPASVREAFSTIQQNSLASGIAFPQSQQAAIWWAILITGFLATLTVWPLFLLLKRTVSGEAAWWTVAMWPLIPAVSVFLPKSDVLYPALAVLAQWMWLESMDRNKWWLGAITGFVIFLSMILSLAFAPVGVILGVQFLFRFRERKQYAAVSGFLGALLIGILLCWVCFELNIVGVWLQNLHNHAAFYKHHTRSYLPWLLVNPIELAFAVGTPLAICGFLGLLSSLKSKDARQRDLWIAAGVWAVLWVSGKNMGEAARLWIFLMPIMAWAAAIQLDRFTTTLRSQTRWVIGIIILQLLICLLTVVRVDGFHLDQI